MAKRTQRTLLKDGKFSVTSFPADPVGRSVIVIGYWGGPTLQIIRDDEDRRLLVYSGNELKIVSWNEQPAVRVE